MQVVPFYRFHAKVQNMNAIFKTGIIYILKIISTLIFQVIKNSTLLLSSLYQSNAYKGIIYVLLRLHSATRCQSLRMLMLSAREKI